MNIALLIFVFVIPVQTTVMEQDAVIEFLLRKVAELERNQRECSGHQNKILLDLNSVKHKLQQSERRISELETIVYYMSSDEYNEKLNRTVEDDPIDNLTSENITNVFIKEKSISRITESKGMHSHKTGIFRRQGRVIASKQIAFCAIMVNGIGSVQNNEIVRFDTVLHNEGNGFNKETGIFTCPLSGTYFFTVSVTTRPSSGAYVHLIVNGKVKGNSFSFGSGSYDQGSISSIVRCEAGYNVWVSAYGASEPYWDYYTSFSGFLLWGDATGNR
ncbi:hypothetical protein CHS0354_018004 [Potamilus streckersoni]|uniref:C1q domain-containing protein n=1 Tax=Potamilus streckersoni TaxID=2493646 RepID=A0AAE0WAT6_9BIVA|nr:hypothetical protein CHS0354_018004 [Potamilus streckersoni]